MSLLSRFSVTTLQAVTWAGAARQIPHRRNSAGGQCVLSCALGQGCKGPKPLQLVRKSLVAHKDC